MNNPLSKLKLYLESAQIALLNQCLSQCKFFYHSNECKFYKNYFAGDSFLKAAISLIPEIPKMIETSYINILEHVNGTHVRLSIPMVEYFLQDYMCNLLSTLLIIPDNPEQGGLYLLNGVLNVIQKHFPWENNEIKFNLLVNFICLLCALKQENYIHHIPNGKNFSKFLYLYLIFINLS